MFEIILADINRKQTNYVLVKRFFNYYVKIIMQHGTWAVVFYRFGSFAYQTARPIRWLFVAIYKILNPFVIWFSGVEINPKSNIGEGFVIHNFSEIVVDAQSIGKNLTINQGVYIGESWEKNGKPSLGNNVFVGSGAKILGNISIGNNVVIASNATVIKDTADNSVVAGVPAVRISTVEDGDYVANVPAHAM